MLSVPSRLALLAAATTAAIAGAAPLIDPRVHRALQENDNGLVNVHVTLKSSSKVLESFREADYSSRRARLEALKSQLTEAHAAAREPLDRLVAQEAATTNAELTVHSFWVDASVVLRNVNVDMLEKIASLPNVESIREELVVPVHEVQVHSQLESVQGYEWGIGQIGAPKVWGDGTTGQNVVVGAIDTGVRATHEALARGFVGANYGWYDPETQKAEPYDHSGHGTHIMATIAGSKGVGVAPAAKWMMCKGCRATGCLEADLVECGQFIFCPSLPDGSKPDCSKAPHVVNNGWAFGQGNTWYKPVVDAWRKAGIVPVFVNGNGGPACATASSPGDYPGVIGVGATTNQDALSARSSRGPSAFGKIKPDIVAPGERIRSAWNTSDNTYRTLSSASFATAHVTGSVALLLSQEPDLTIDEIKVRLFTTTEQRALVASNSTCGGTTDANWPNNQFGHGRLNVFQAYQGYRPSLRD